MFYWGTRLKVFSPDGAEAWNLVHLVTPSGGDEIAKAAPGRGRQIVVLTANWINIGNDGPIIQFKKGVGGTVFTQYIVGGIRKGYFKYRGGPVYLGENVPLVARHAGFGLSLNEHYINFGGLILG